MSLQKSEETDLGVEPDLFFVLLPPALVVFMSFILMAGMNIGKEFFPEVVVVSAMWTIVRMARPFDRQYVGTLMLMAVVPCIAVILAGSFALNHF